MFCVFTPVSPSSVILSDFHSVSVPMEVHMVADMEVDRIITRLVGNKRA